MEGKKTTQRNSVKEVKHKIRVAGEVVWGQLLEVLSGTFSLGFTGFSFLLSGMLSFLKLTMDGPFPLFSAAPLEAIQGF